MGFFKSTTELKISAGGAVNASLELASIEPTVRYVAERYLQPWVGKTLLDECEAYIASNYTPVDTVKALLLANVQAALAPLSLEEYSKIAAVQMSEAGMFRIESEERRTPYKYQETEWRRSMRAHGFNALERLIQVLEDNKDEELFASWLTEARPRAKGLFINSAAELRDVYSSYVDRATFEAIRPIIEDLESFIVKARIGPTEFDRMKGFILNGLPSQDAEIYTTAIRYLQKAIGLAAVNEAMKRHWVTIKESQLVQTEILEPQGYMREGSPSGQSLSTTLLHLDSFSARELSLALDYLAAHPEQFPNYAAFVAQEPTSNCANYDVDPDADRPVLFNNTDTYQPRPGSGLIRM
jgi:hypothetical protein